MAKCNCANPQHDFCWYSFPDESCSCCMETLKNKTDEAELKRMAKEQNKLFVRCCEDNNDDNIWFDEETASFRYSGNDEEFIYCPWCGILLDMNLEMTPSQPLEA